MAKFAVLRFDNTVDNIIVAETLEIAETFTNAKCVEYDDSDGIIDGNSIYNPENKSWTRKEPITEDIVVDLE